MGLRIRPDGIQAKPSNTRLSTSSTLPQAQMTGSQATIRSFMKPVDLEEILSRPVVAKPPMESSQPPSPVSTSPRLAAKQARIHYNILFTGREGLEVPLSLQGKSVQLPTSEMTGSLPLDTLKIPMSSELSSPYSKSEFRDNKPPKIDEKLVTDFLKSLDIPVPCDLNERLKNFQEYPDFKILSTPSLIRMMGLSSCATSSISYPGMRIDLDSDALYRRAVSQLVHIIPENISFLAALPVDPLDIDESGTDQHKHSDAKCPPEPESGSIQHEETTIPVVDLSNTSPVISSDVPSSDGTAMDTTSPEKRLTESESSHEKPANNETSLEPSEMALLLSDNISSMSPIEIQTSCRVHLKRNPMRVEKIQ
eukprot:452439_1